jgi:hypothetical protein
MSRWIPIVTFFGLCGAAAAEAPASGWVAVMPTCNDCVKCTSCGATAVLGDATATEIGKLLVKVTPVPDVGYKSVTFTSVVITVGSGPSAVTRKLSATELKTWNASTSPELVLAPTELGAWAKRALWTAASPPPVAVAGTVELSKGGSAATTGKFAWTLKVTTM